MPDIKKNTNKELRLIDKYLIIILAMYPILGEYILKYLPINLADILFFLVFVIGFVIGRYRYIHINLKVWFIGIILAVYNVLIGFSYSSLSNSIHNSLAILLAFTIISLIEGNIQLELGYYFKVMMIIGAICTAFIVIQTILLRQGVIVYGKLTFLENWFKYDNEYCFQSVALLGRPTSLFYEPAHYAIFMAPVLLISLYCKKYVLSAFFIVGIFLSTSSTGYGIAFTILAVYCMFTLKGYKKVIFTLAFIVGSIIFFGKTDFDYSKFQLSNLSQNIRVFGTLSYFKYFDISDFFFGIGFNRLTEWASINSITVSNYASSFIFIVFSFGLLGIALIIWFVIKIFNYKKFWLPMSVIVTILVSVDQLCFNRNFIYLVACLFITRAMVHKNSDGLGKLVKGEYNCHAIINNSSSI